MEKQRYYVSVQAKTIMAEQGEAPYELVIDATYEELQKLNELFESLNDFDEKTFIRVHIPAIPYHHDSENDGYDYYLKEIYHLIHQIGTEETRNQIESMNILID